MIMPETDPKNLNYAITPITEAIFFGVGNELRNYNLNYVITLGLRIFQANTPITQLRNYTVTKNPKPSTCLASGMLHASLNFLREKK